MNTRKRKSLGPVLLNVFRVGDQIFSKRFSYNVQGIGLVRLWFYYPSTDSFLVEVLGAPGSRIAKRDQLMATGRLLSELDD